MDKRGDKGTKMAGGVEDLGSFVRKRAGRIIQSRTSDLEVAVCCFVYVK
jgi:hypothetical protein